MKVKIIATAVLLGTCVHTNAQENTFWIPSEDRSQAATTLSFDEADSIVFRNNRVQVYANGKSQMWLYSRTLGYSSAADSSVAFYVGEPERAIWKPTTSDNNYNNDYNDPESQWSYKNSKESKHFICFWDKRFGDDPNASSVPANLRVDVDDMLEKVEQFFATNVEKIGMCDIGEGKSRLDDYKMMIHLLYDTGWTAVGSGYDDMIGALWVTPSTSHPVGHTIAHETGHCFQYMTAVDHRKNGVSNYLQRGWRYGFGANGSGGNAFWEQCAQWQGFRNYPSQVFGYDVDVWLANYHRHCNHEWMRYASYWWPYHIVEKNGERAFGQLWRESKYPEDPLETYTRLFCDGNWDTFWNDYFEYATKLPNYQFEEIHKYLNTRYSARNYKTAMYLGDDEYYQVAYRSCPETSGINFVQLGKYKVGEEVAVDFAGLDPGSPLHASDPGHAFLEDGGGKYDVVTTYNTVGKPANRGWHYAFVAIVNDGTTNGNTVVSDIMTSDEG
ncbi:MAG: hypothetical protein K6C30_05880, partial [Bacteroidaceae bacterium]|nr:hypothetical protein [Bacteroidaceae bacterium]